MISGLLVTFLLAWQFDATTQWLRWQAERQLKSADPHGALSRIETIVSRKPSEPAGWLLGARAYLQLNMNQLAGQYVDQAARAGATPNAIETYRSIIRAQGGQAAAMDRLLQSDNGQAVPPEAYEALVRGAQYQNDLRRAELILDELQRLRLTPWVVHYQRGRIHELSDHPKEALAEYSKAFQTQPRMLRAAFRAAMCQSKTGNFEAAAELLRRVLVPPYKPVAEIELANCLWEQGLYQAALDTLEPALNLKPSELQTLYLQLDEFVDGDRAALAAGRNHDSLGHSRQAVEALQRVLHFNHRDFEARTLLIKNLRIEGRSAEAEALAAVQTQMMANRQRCRQLRFELEENPRDIDRLCELAELYWYTESEAEAQLVLRDVLELDPKNVRAQRLIESLNAARTAMAGGASSAAAAQSTGLVPLSVTDAFTP